MIEQVEFGATGLHVSKLCFGTGTNGWNSRSEQSDLGIDGLSSLLLYAHSQGITFWDSADQYGTHPHIARALQQVDRSSVVVTTKTNSRKPNEVRADVERFSSIFRPRQPLRQRR